MKKETWVGVQAVEKDRQRFTNVEEAIYRSLLCFPIAMYNYTCIYMYVYVYMQMSVFAEQTKEEKFNVGYRYATKKKIK